MTRRVTYECIELLKTYGSVLHRHKRKARQECLAVPPSFKFNYPFDSQ